MNPADFDQLHEILLRLGAAMFLGGAIGVNRDLHHKPAGLRVLAIVSVGSALVTMLMLTVAAEQKNVTYDGLSRVVQGILQGIGFLGAGVIMRAKGRNEIHGLTTASSVWLTAVLGVGCGLGQWQLSLAAFAVSVFILTIGRRIERLILSMNPLPEDAHASNESPSINP